jgi:NADH-ubiquinone oxidoreductase chain 3
LFQWEEQGALPWKSFSGSNPHLSVFFSVCRSASKERREESERTKWALVMSEFAPICIYLVISPLVSLIPLGVPFPFASNSSTYPEKLSAYECGSDPSGDARSRFDIRFYLVPILFIIPDPEVTFSFPWAVPPNKIDLFGSWSMMAFLLILTIGSLYEWKRGASDRE